MKHYVTAMLFQVQATFSRDWAILNPGSGEGHLAVIGHILDHLTIRSRPAWPYGTKEVRLGMPQVMFLRFQWNDYVGSHCIPKMLLHSRANFILFT